LDFNKLLENKKLQGTAVITAAVFFVTFLYFIDPNRYTYYPLCTFKKITGYDCPGCGGIRGTYELLHLHFYNAYVLNPLVYISTPLLLYTVIYFISLIFFQKQLPKVPINGVTVTIVAILIGLFWILRNIF